MVQASATAVRWLKSLLHFSFQCLQILLKDIPIKREWDLFPMPPNNNSLVSADIITLFRTVATYLHFTTGGLPAQFLLRVVRLIAANVTERTTTNMNVGVR
jgi:hypothetical protein